MRGSFETQRDTQNLAEEKAGRGQDFGGAFSKWLFSLGYLAFAYQPCLAWKNTYHPA